MSTWIKEKPAKSWGQSFCESVLKCGNIPKHIAIIMDGNRRFAVKKKYERSVGHLLGFNKVSETLEWCSGLGVNEVTLYAFSLENFKRSKEEVDCLMELAKQKFSALLAEIDLVVSHGLCVRIIGNLTYLPRDLQAILAEVIHSTRHNNKVFLNVCCAYTSQEEMTQSMKKMRDGVGGGWIVPSDIDEGLFERCLYTGECSEPDILIRTSGEVRLSDFLLWQTSYSMLSFTPVLWPEFSKWHLYSFILLYQLNHHHFVRAREDRALRRAKQRHNIDTRVARQLLKQFPMVMKQAPDLNHLDDLIKKLKVDGDDDDDDALFSLNLDFRSSLSKSSIPLSTTTAATLTNPSDTTSATLTSTATLTTDAKPLATTTSTELSTTTPATADHCSIADFERLLVVVTACRERRCGRFVEKVQKDYDDYIESLLNISACRVGDGPNANNRLDTKNRLDSKSELDKENGFKNEFKKNGLKLPVDHATHQLNGGLKGSCNDQSGRR